MIIFKEAFELKRNFLKQSFELMSFVILEALIPYQIF